MVQERTSWSVWFPHVVSGLEVLQDRHVAIRSLSGRTFGRLQRVHPESSYSIRRGSMVAHLQSRQPSAEWTPGAHQTIAKGQPSVWIHWGLAVECMFCGLDQGLGLLVEGAWNAGHTLARSKQEGGWNHWVTGLGTSIWGFPWGRPGSQEEEGQEALWGGQVSFEWRWNLYPQPERNRDLRQLQQQQMWHSGGTGQVQEQALPSVQQMPRTPPGHEVSWEGEAWCKLTRGN